MGGVAATESEIAVVQNPVVDVKDFAWDGGRQRINLSELMARAAPELTGLGRARE